MTQRKQIKCKRLDFSLFEFTEAHDDVCDGEVEEVEVGGGAHVLVAEHHGEDHEVAANPHHEDHRVQEDEDGLHPALVDEQLPHAAEPEQ